MAVYCIIQYHPKKWIINSLLNLNWNNMCGIAGLLTDSLSNDTTYESITRCVQALHRRGPDGQGLFQDEVCTLGHARLAVIDTSEAGAQPLSQNGVTLVYNGELYTFRQERVFLEKYGHTFRGYSDAEVLLHMYLQYGEDFLPRLRGMYAFALWDSRTKTLLCARDPLGIKPFLYAVVSSGFIFASEIKALLASGLVSRTVNPKALYALLLRGSVPQQTHILRDVCWLTPGHVLTIQAGQTPRVRPFCRISPPSSPFQASWPDMLAEASRQVQKALRRQMVADVPLGAFLSGGIDSSLLVALMQQEQGRVRAFSVGFERDLQKSPEDETEDAEAVARHLDVEHTTVIVTQQDVLNALPSIAAALDHPTVDGVNSFFVARAVSRELTVAISGTGGDELFAGYPWFSAMQRWSRASVWERLRRRYGWRRVKEDFCSIFNGQYAIFSPDRAAALMENVWGDAALVPPTREDPFPTAEPLNRVTGLLLAGYTRDQLLADIDAAASWHGLEVRVPLLDEDLLHFALSIPEDAKIGHRDLSAPKGSYAHMGIKRLLVEIGQPLLPEGFSRRAKRGFSLPFDAWLHGKLAPVLQDLLAPATVSSRGFFDARIVETITRKYLAGHSVWIYPWLLMIVELWAQEVLDA